MLGVILDTATLAPDDLDTGAFDACLPAWRRYAHTAPEQVAERIAEAEVVFTNKVPIGAAQLAAAPQLRLIAVMATGTDHVDLAAARERGVAVCNVVDYSTAAVVQHTLALMLALATRLPEYRDAVRRGEWQRSPQFWLPGYPVRELAGRRLGIVGYGAIGRGVAALAQALGMTVAVAQRPGAPAAAGRVPLEQLLPTVDVLSLHCPLTPRTRHLINAPRLALMRPDAWLINTARGALVDAAALAAALRGGRLGGAGIDVLDREPPPADHPLLAADIPNLIVTPHCAWASREARQRLVDQLAQVVAAFCAGAPRNLVNIPAEEHP